MLMGTEENPNLLVEKRHIQLLLVCLFSLLLYGDPGYGLPTPQRGPRHGQLWPGGLSFRTSDFTQDVRREGEGNHSLSLYS